MMDEFAVKFAIEYLNHCFDRNLPANLVGMLNHVDYFERVAMSLDEINAALAQRPQVHFQRINDRVIFNQTSGEREITQDDLKQNFAIYETEFRAK